MPGKAQRTGALILAIAAILLPWPFMGRLPAQIPVSWTWGGEVAAYASRPLGALLMPLLTLLVFGLLASMPRISPKEFSYPPLALIHSGVELAIVAFMSLLSGLILLLAAGMPVAQGRGALGGLGILIAALGMVMPALGRRSWRDIRGGWPKTYSDIWTGAHALAARLLVPAGALVAGLAALGASLTPAVLLVPTAFFLPLVPAFVACWKMESARQRAEPSGGPSTG